MSSQIGSKLARMFGLMVQTVCQSNNYLYKCRLHPADTLAGRVAGPSTLLRATPSWAHIAMAQQPNMFVLLLLVLPSCSQLAAQKITVSV
jgi:hypothetical protein